MLKKRVEEDRKGEKQVEFNCWRQHPHSSFAALRENPQLEQEICSLSQSMKPKYLNLYDSKSRLMSENNMHLMDLLCFFFSLGCASCYTLQNPFNIIIHSLPSGDKRETWEQSKLPKSISCLEDPSRSQKRVMVRLKLPPGLTVMSEVNVNHWFLFRAKVTFPLSLKLSLSVVSFSLVFYGHTHTHTGCKNLILCFLPSNKKWERGKRGREGKVERAFQYKRMEIKGHSIYSSKHIKCQLMLLNLSCFSFYLGPAMQHPEDKKINKRKFSFHN